MDTSSWAIVLGGLAGIITVIYLARRMFRGGVEISAELCPHGYDWDYCPVCRH